VDVVLDRPALAGRRIMSIKRRFTASAAVTALENTDQRTVPQLATSPPAELYDDVRR
jgi:hypothetical protein